MTLQKIKKILREVTKILDTLLESISNKHLLNSSSYFSACIQCLRAILHGDINEGE